MKTPPNSFDAADLTLCRAHGNAVSALVKSSDVREPSAVDYNLGLASWLMELDTAKRQALYQQEAKPSAAMQAAVDLVRRLTALASVSHRLDPTGSEQPEPAKPVQQAQATHSVCVKEHDNHRVVLKVGFISSVCIQDINHPDCWLPCDKGGWVTHEPRPDSVCPVPAGVLCAIKQDDGKACGVTEINPPRSGDGWFGWESFIIAWRPTGAAA